ncbi:hypothetical protein DFH07DRAFT_969878 [Mycena maculata]|uniref:CxC2-like cysteine cluster KDZ transposase-associated domain-containing protein n=1 Tax=Mycena maculata TaxID=230809 RepID=A0AAD7HW27_9AGAR|nr:hypothetical protein DFH07DRAFT_969878 [Mycena maculata]
MNQERNRGGRPRKDAVADTHLIADWGVGAEADTMVSSDRGVCFSGNSRKDVLLNVSHKKRRLDPDQLEDPLASWIPVPDAGLEFTPDEDPPEPQMGEKRKRYENSEWTGSFWEWTTLKDLGFVYQVGHGGGPCVFPDPKKRTLTVLEHPYIHQLHFRYCNCSKSDHADPIQQLLRNGWYPATVVDPGTCTTFTTLETFRLQNVVGNMNPHDFITAMERQTNTVGVTGINRPPTHYKEFMWMSRQWAWLVRMKRAGRIHDPAGVDAMASGEAAVKCWTCPYEGRNLPPEWRDVDLHYQFLYMLILALDANFKLKNCIRTNAHFDPSLGPGYEYFLEPNGYREHLRNYVPEKDVSSCIVFAALLQKDSRATAGLRVTGVGGCVCARHECVRPNGIGDLQKGERYANMDYIALCALAGFCLLWLTLSYDIACQWKMRLPQRMEKMPEHLRLPLKDIKWQCALPVWHAGSHEGDCQNENSLSVKPGVGMSDGEGVEQTWAVLNPASYHTKDMNTGNREDTLNDKIDSHNYSKNLGQGHALQQKLIIAIAERARQVAAFKEVNATVEKDLRKEWLKQITDWLADSTKPNPYILDKSDVPSEAQVRLALKKEEEEEVRAGRTPLHGTSATAFIMAGIQLEDSQSTDTVSWRWLRAWLWWHPDKENKIQDRRTTLLAKLAKFHALQAIFMPGVARMLAEEEEACDGDLPPLKPEHIKLWMPHEVAKEERAASCVRGLTGIEARLWVSQCLNSLVLLRSRLHAKRHFISFSNANLDGQVMKTKSQTLVGQLGDQVASSAERYRQGRHALVRLQGAKLDPQFRELKAADLTLDGDHAESDAASKKKLVMIGSGRGARAPRNAPGGSRRVMFWIWTAQGGAADGEEHLHESVRVEWCRARARKLRWEEEVLLVREEMRRVLRYLDWQVKWWEDQVGAREEASQEVAAGAKAYALKQAAVHRQIADCFTKQWNTPARLAARRIMAGAPSQELEGAELDEFFLQ